jgi:ABC-2 type transport system permease protein
MENNSKIPNKIHFPDRKLFSKLLVYYFKIWWKMSKNSFLIVLSNKTVFFVFLFAKIFRFVMFFSFLYFLVLGTSDILGYNSDQIIFLFLTFNLIDIVSQFLFREVYRFRNLVVSGDFDLIMLKPYNTLFRSLMGGADIIDFVTIPPLLISMFYFGLRLEPTFFQILTYTILVLNGLLISSAFHIAVLGMGIITMEIDHTIMIYRDIVALGKLPIDVYRAPLGIILTYLLPVGIMITYPVKALAGSLSYWTITGSLVFGVMSIILSLKFWNFALKKYSSASS